MYDLQLIYQISMKLVLVEQKTLKQLQSVLMCKIMCACNKYVKLKERLKDVMSKSSRLCE